MNKTVLFCALTIALVGCAAGDSTILDDESTDWSSADPVLPDDIASSQHEATLDTCGDGQCNRYVEDPINCPQDCYCGDFICHSSEIYTCALDCVVCGDNYCNPFLENHAMCPQDCDPVCGDDICTAGFEDTANCHEDCGTQCGDGVCNGDETFFNCPSECLPPPLTISISGPADLDSGQTGTWNGTVQSGVPPYSYTWAKTTNSSSANLGNGTSATASDTETFNVILDVTDGEGRFQSEYVTVTVEGSSGGGDIPF